MYDVKDLDYTGKDAQIMINEFNILLNDICTIYDNKIFELETTIQQMQVATTAQQPIHTLKQKFRISNFIFKVIRKIAKSFGITYIIKKTSIYKKLKDKGTIDKLK